MEKLFTQLVQDYDQGKMTRRQLVANLTIAAAAAATTSGAAFAQTPGYVAKATNLNHISYNVKDYKVSRDFYVGLFGMRVQDDTGKECRLKFGDSEITLTQGERDIKPPIIDHIGLTIEGWDTDKAVIGKLIAEVKRRGLKTKSGGASFHIYDPDGFDVQVGGADQGRTNPMGPIHPDTYPNK